jgi:tyrocidine synthetase-3
MTKTETKQPAAASGHGFQSGTICAWDKSVCWLFEEQVVETPHHIAVTARSPEGGYVQLTYKTLDKKASQLAGVLRDNGVGHGDIVAITMERSVEMITGIFGILKAGAAYLPMDPEIPEERKEYMLKDSRAVTFPEVEFVPAREYHGVDAKLSYPAYVIYTSGSTGRPKGVLVEHGNLTAYLAAFEKEFALTHRDTVLQQASGSFDAFVEEVYPVLLKGGKIAVADRKEVQDPRLLTEFIIRHGVTVIDCSPLLLNELDKLLPAAVQHRYPGYTFISGGDVLKYRYIAALLELGNVYNTYGPTETTVCATYYRCPSSIPAEISSDVPIGTPIAGYGVLIVNSDGTPVPEGELMISGPGVTRGYLNQPELTLEKYDWTDGTDASYRTGDRARWLPDGNIMFLGRIDRQVKIRGYRIELGEIETLLLSHPGVKEAVVTTREDEDGDKYLAAYIVSHGPDKVDIRGLKDFLGVKFPAYMVPWYLKLMAQLPKTASGKVDRNALPGPDGDMEPGYDPPGNDIEHRLTGIWQEILKRDKIGIHDNFFQLGGHSLKAMTMISKIREEFLVELRAADLFDKPTIREIAGLVTGMGKYDLSTMEAVEEKEYYPPSSMQKQFFILNRLENLGVAYNIPDMVVFEGKVDFHRVEACCRELIGRHDSLRTSFLLIDGELVQRVHRPGDIDFRLDYVEVEGKGKQRSLEIKSIIADIVRPFDLERPPLFRMVFVKVEEKKSLLIYDLHHIIADGMSTLILMEELFRLLEGVDLPGPVVQYKDFSQWQNRALKTGQLEKQRKYWVNLFKGEIPVLSLPTDYPPPPIQSFEGDQVVFYLRNPLRDRLYGLAGETGTTLFMVLLATYNVLLSRYTGQEDIVIGSPTAGRNQSDLENSVGLFINVLALRNFPAGELKFEEFLKQVKHNTLNAFDNRDYPYGELLENLGLKKDLSKNPLFSVELILHNIELVESGAKIGGSGLKQYGYSMKTTQLDITVEVVEGPEEIACSLIYCTQLFSRNTIERAVRRFTRLADLLCTNPGIRLSRIPLLSEEEKQRILIDFNGSEIPLPAEQRLHFLFDAQARKTPDRTAVNSRVQISYGELNQRANRLAVVLQSKGVKPDDITAIMVERSVEMFIGLLGIMKAGGAYLPIDPEAPEERIKYMLEDSNARVLIEGVFESSEFGSGLFPAAKSSNLAYVIYTSGSTGRPKGVLVEHRQLAAYLTAFAQEFTITENDIVVQQSSYFFDAFAEEVYPVLLKGGKVAVPRKTEIPDTRLFTAFIIKHGVNLIDCSPLLLNELNKRLPIEASRVRLPGFTFIGGGDVLKRDHIHRLLHLGDVYNTYGPTESTVCATYYRCRIPMNPGEPHVPIGKPIANYGVYLLDKNDVPVPIGVVGELCISGPGVTRGYLNQPELTAEKFMGSNKSNWTYRSDGSCKSYRTYRSGDLGKWRQDGNIMFMGRLDSQVKIRGFRIELGEIEHQLETHPTVEQSVVLVLDDASGEKKICAYVLPALPSSGGPVKPIPPARLREFLLKRLPSYMVPSYFVSVLHWPVTPTGKIDRNALPKLEHLLQEAEYEAPRNALEHRLTEIWAELLGIEKTKISIDANFFHLGGHSLKATQLVTELYKELNVKISMAGIFTTPTIRGLARCIEDTGETLFISIKPAEKKEYYRLSPAQKRMYIGQQLDPETPGYNGDIHRRTLDEIFAKLIARHESFRTSFHVIDGEPVQKINELVDFFVEYYDLSPVVNGTSYPMSFVHLFVRSFDLSQAPLFRAGLAKMTEGRHLLIMDMHHIISDGLSLQLFTREFTDLYSGRALAPLRLQYKDYSEWINDRLNSREAEIMKQEEYWLKQFEGKVPVLSLPLDYPRPAIRNFEGLQVTFPLGEVQAYHLQTVAVEKDATLYIVLLALFYVFLAKISGRSNIVVGTPVAGRRHPDLQPIIGMFVNTLALRLRPLGEKTFREFLEEVRNGCLEAFENQDYQFEELVNKLEVERDASRNPLFDVMFTLRTREKKGMGIPHPEIQELPSSYDYSTRAALFDLTLLAIEEDEGLLFTLEYSTKLFAMETIERFLNYFKKVISSVLEDPGIRLSHVEIISPEEKKWLLYEINNTAAPYPEDKTIHRLFEEQADALPGKIALIDPEGRASITYGELDRQARGLAFRLKEEGLCAGDRAAVMAERTIEVLTGLLAILKCGAVYLPIAPHYPLERQRYIISDVQARLLLTPTRRTIPGIRSTVRVDGSIDAHVEMMIDDEEGITPYSPAYIIYTSGSTGLPKGVMVRHRSVVRLVKETDYFHFHRDSRILQTCALEFDVSVFEIFGALLNGMTLCLTSREQVSWPEMLKELIRKNHITSMWLTAPLFNRMLDADIDMFKELRDLLVGGEALSPPHINRLRAEFPGLNIINGYGPTENTTFSTAFSIRKEYRRSIPIGKPISNSTAYIVDRFENPLPVGIIGELCVGGDGAALGYINRPELTAEKFINNPFLRGNIIYRTGDLARWMPDGNIEFHGRMDSQVKIRGNRIELGEIEHCISTHPRVKAAEITVRRGSGEDRYICAYYVPVTEIENGGIEPVTAGELSSFLAENLPDFMIPSYFIQMDKFPLTASGKVDKTKLPEPDFGELVGRYAPPADDLELRLVEIWSEILGVEKALIGVHTNFFQLGGHSLKATILAARLHNGFNVRVQFAELFRLRTVRKLADHIRKKQQERYEVIPGAEMKEYYPLAPEQVKMYYRQRSAGPDTTIFNMPWVSEMDALIGAAAEELERIFKELIQRHENLRTSFHMVDGIPVQKIAKSVDFRITYFNTPYTAEEVPGESPSFIYPIPNADLIRYFVRPFNLARAPLFRVGVVMSMDGKCLLMMDMHHLVSDGTSIGILLKELKTLLKGEKLFQPRLQYKDYSQWQNSEAAETTRAVQEAYWIKRFSGDIPVLALPFNYPRPPVKNTSAKVLHFEFGADEVYRLKKLVRSENCTLFMLMLTLFYMMLFKLTGSPDIVVSTFTAGRRNPGVQQVVGMFVNTLLLRNFPTPSKLFKDFLKEVKEQMLDAYENQEYHYDLLVEKLVKEPDESRNPLAGVNFVLQNLEMETSELEGLFTTADVFDLRTSFYDLRFEGYEKNDKLFFDVEYDWKLFERETAAGFIDCFKRIVASVLKNPSKELIEYI